MKNLSAVMGVTILIAGILAGCGGRVDPGKPASPVTVPNGSTPPGEEPSGLYHGNGELWTILWPEGTIPFSQDRPGEIRADGSLAMKFPWWRGEGVRGELVIHGKPVNGKGDTVYGEVPAGYGETGFQASAIILPGEGCWEITGRVGDAALSFIQRVEVTD